MISVIIPTYNKAAYLNLTLASFVPQTSKDFEVVVVDDGSVDETANIANSYKSKLNLVYIKQLNQGRSKARNTGILACSGDSLVFNDDDRIVKKDFITKHADALKEDGEFIYIGGKGKALTIWSKNKLPLQRNDTKILASRFGEQWKTISKSTYTELLTTQDIEMNFDESMEKVFLGNEFESDHVMGVPINEIPDFRLSWTIGTTANLSVRKDAVIEVGMFDTEFKGWGMEDSELCYRLCTNGMRVKEYPSAYNYHQIHPIGRRFLHQTLSMTRRNELHRNINYFHEKFKTPGSFVFHRAFYSNTPPLIANEILIQFESDLTEKALPYSEWDSLYRTIVKNRSRYSWPSKVMGWLKG
jgi:glycosyltransferase involved in cell wall biosynthesis